MKRKVIICLLVLSGLLSVVSMALADGVDQTITIGKNGIRNLAEAVSAISSNAANVRILLNGNSKLTQQIELPVTLSELRSVTLDSYKGSAVTVDLGGSVLCANGIPLQVSENVSIKNGFIVGGACVSYGGDVKLEESTLMIKGSVENVVAGGLAIGSGAASSVEHARLYVDGTVQILLGGGMAYSGGKANVSGSTDMLLTPDSNVKGAVYGGGYASDQGSSAQTADVFLTALGDAGAIYRDQGLAENGGTAQVGNYKTQPEQFSQPVISQPVIPEPDPTTVLQQPNNNSSTVIRVGIGQQASDMNAALSLIPYNPGNVTFLLSGSIQQNKDVVLPMDRNILSVTVLPASGSATVNWDENVGFYACGIPLTIGSGVTFNNGTVYGGCLVQYGGISNLPVTTLDIAGTVNKVVGGSKAKGNNAVAHVDYANITFRGKATGWIYGGGAAEYGGFSSVDIKTTIKTLPGSSVAQSMTAGGLSFGSGSEAEVWDAELSLSGSVTYAVYLGGYADQSSRSQVLGQSILTLESAGYVGQSVWYGGRSYKDSNTFVQSAEVHIYGRVGATVHDTGRASDGGTADVETAR